HEQAVRVLYSKPIRLQHTQLNNGPVHYSHPENCKKLLSSGKATTIHMSHGEVLSTHQSRLDGSRFWGDLWGGIKKGATAWNFLKDNWKPIAGTILDKVADLAAPETGGLSKGFKTLTGVGMEQQSAAPRRGRRKKVGINPSGSFRLA
ncbi:hypothetical protein THRCLA_22619, partial [Thraustotheca clavata]